MIHQFNYPIFPKREPEEGAMISAVKLVGDDLTWHDFEVKTQPRLVYDAAGRVEVVVSYEGCNNTFEFTKDSVKRLSHQGALLDLCWVDFVGLAEGEAQPDFCPEGVKVVGAPWVLKDPHATNDVGRESDWVFEDTTRSVVEEQWHEEAKAVFKKENRDGSHCRFAVRAMVLVKKEEKYKKCFGLFHGTPPEINFWRDMFSYVTWGTIRFRRLTLYWKGDVDLRNGVISLMVTTPGFEVEIAGVINHQVMGGATTRSRGVGTVLCEARGLNPADFIRAIAASEVVGRNPLRDTYTPTYPTPRTSKRGIFRKR